MYILLLLLQQHINVLLFFIFLLFFIAHYAHCHLCLHAQPQPHHPFVYPPTQTRIASPAPLASACQTGQRTSSTVCSRWSWPGQRPCLCGGQAPCRPGWRLSWRCPCTSAPAQKTSKAARYGNTCRFLHAFILFLTL